MSMSKSEEEYQMAHIHETRTGQMKAAALSCLFIVFFSTVFRFTSKISAKRKWHSEDLTIVIASILMIAYCCGSLIHSFHYKFGYHDLALSETDIYEGLKVVFIVGIFYSIGYYMIKIAILQLYHRIFAIPWFRTCNTIAIAFNVGLLISTTFASIFSCLPIKAFWDLSVPNPKCYDWVTFFWAQAILNVVSDVVILILPMPVLYKLLMDRTQKILLSVVFALGGATCVVSIIRVVTYQYINVHDTNWTLVPGSIATLVEIALGVVCANLPTYKPIAVAIFGTVRPITSCFNNRGMENRLEEDDDSERGEKGGAGSDGESHEGGGIRKQESYSTRSEERMKIGNMEQVMPNRTVPAS